MGTVAYAEVDYHPILRRPALSMPVVIRTLPLATRRLWLHHRHILLFRRFPINRTNIHTGWKVTMMEVETES